MRRLSFVFAALAAVAVLIAGWQMAQPARAALNLNVHVHDLYYHPAGTFIVGSATDHNLAKANCQVSNPPPNCDANITAGDTITWVAPAPLASLPHTVTECTDNTFTVCGPAVSAANPIDDSGVRAGPSPGPSGWPYGPITFSQAGTYYYRCQLHPGIMRGRIVVQANTAVGGAVELLDISSGDGRPWAIVAAVVALFTVAAAGGVVARRRMRRET